MRVTKLMLLQRIQALEAQLLKNIEYVDDDYDVMQEKEFIPVFRYGTYIPQKSEIGCFLNGPRIFIGPAKKWSPK